MYIPCEKSLNWKGIAINVSRCVKFLKDKTTEIGKRSGAERG